MVGQRGIAIFGVVACAIAAGAQVRRHGSEINVAGQVTSADHRPLTGAVVYCENDATQQVETRLADATGSYAFKHLAGDTDYHVWAAFKGADSKKKFLSKFDSKTEREIDLEIK